MRCPFPEERERERKRERLVEVSSPWIVPAIIYFLSDRGDRLYGGCSVQAPGSAGLPGSAYVLPTSSLVPGYRDAQKISVTELIPGAKISMSKILVIRFKVSIFRRSLDILSLFLCLCLSWYFRFQTRFRTWTYFSSDP